MKKLIFLAVSFLLGLYCVSGIVTAAEIPTLAFKKHVVIDREGFGYEALRLLVPKGWHFKGGVLWNYNKVPPEASTAFTISSPDGSSVLEQFPHITLFWSQDSNLQLSYSRAGMEIVQPMGATDFLKNFFIPRFRSNVSGIKVIESQSLPELAQQSRDLAQFQMRVFGQISPFRFQFEIRADAGRLKMEYFQGGGEKIVEDATVAITYIIAYLPTMYGGYATGITWIPIVSSFKAPEKEINAKVRIFKIIMDSRKDNPVWVENCIKLSASVTRDKIRQQRAIFNRMQQISKTQSEIGDMIMDSYQKRNDAYDRIFDNYSQAIRGVDSYKDPINDWKIDLPTGYDNAWTNGSEYIISDDAGFNPNVGSTQNWEQMKRQR
ncbi:MAG: hypothetical protein JRI26_06660 [Deltaproteobacteria bacterium]|nr:hypothetical protein [Deltaproteobacteria bacterium]